MDGETSSSARKQHGEAGGSASGGSGAGQPAPRQGPATLSLRAEMIAPALGVRLTPIAAPALLHTALYQSLLGRGAEDKLQSGWVAGLAPGVVIRRACIFGVFSYFRPCANCCSGREESWECFVIASETSAFSPARVLPSQHVADFFVTTAVFGFFSPCVARGVSLHTSVVIGSIDHPERLTNLEDFISLTSYHIWVVRMRHHFPNHPFLHRGGTNAFCAARRPPLFLPPRYRLVTLNEGRRAVLLSDNDPLSLRAPIVGVWVSGGDSGGTGGVGTPSGQQQQSGRRPSPLTHPYVYPACLRFLLGFRGGDGASKATTVAAAASPVAFLVLQLPGGVGGGTPACYEACAVSAAAAPTPTAAGGGVGGMRVSSVGFEQLDFSADVDVSVGGGGREGGAAGGANRAVVIARLRRVSSLTAAGGAFGRALARARGRCEDNVFFSPAT